MTQKQAQGNIEEYQDRVLQQKKLVRECFTGPAGSQVLKALREEFYDIQMEPDESLQFQAGQRDVIFQILLKMGDL